MSKKKRYIPELRFPEFRKEGKWITKSIGSISKVSAGGTPTSTEPKYWGGDIPWMNSGELNLKKIYEVANSITELGLKESSTKKIPPLCVLIGLAGQGKTRGTAAINYIELCTNQSIAAIHPNKVMFNSEFLFHRIDFMYKTLRRLSTGQGGRGGLNLSIIKEIEIPFPQKKEQQKIASCLSSLDELIATHKDKLQTLKDHKKGLMQNLFPQEGQKVPNYRFPEFVMDGEWVENKLGEIGEPLMCKRIFKVQTTANPEGGIPFYKIGTFGKEANSFISVELYNEFRSKYNFPNKGDILISASGTIGRLVIYDGEPAYFQDSNIVWLGHDGNEVTNNFLYYCYSIVSWQTSDGGVIKRLYNTDLKNISITFPESETEQQKIASCLSAVDELITAQSERIEQLQQHKKGLMQGLFPKMTD